MPRYLVIHHAPGVSQEDFQRNIPEVLRGKHAAFVHTYVNLAAGTIVNIYDGDSPGAGGPGARAHRLPLRGDPGNPFPPPRRRSPKDGGRRLVAAGRTMATRR